MNIVDVIVLIIIGLCGLYGFKNGFIKQAASLVGMILVFCLSFAFKDPIAEWMTFNLPFFSFVGKLSGASILNVVMYQLIAFFIIFSILLFIYHLVIRITGLIEKLLKLTIILAIPSKILGLILGILEGFVISMVAIIVLANPLFDLNEVRESTSRKYLYHDSPIIGNITKEFNGAINDVAKLKDEYDNNEDRENFNLQCLDALLKHKIIGTDYTEKLIYSGKLDIDKDKALSILNNYK